MKANSYRTTDDRFEVSELMPTLYPGVYSIRHIRAGRILTNCRISRADLRDPVKLTARVYRALDK